MSTEHNSSNRVAQWTDRVVDSYRHIGTIDHLGICPLPKYGVVVSILEDLTDILYPGYRRREGLHMGNITYHVGDLVDRIHDQLFTQICRALRHDARVNRGFDPCDEAESNYEERARHMTESFLDRIVSLREILATDVQAAFEGDPACRNIDEVIFCYPGLEAVTIYRIAHQLHLLGVPFIPRMMTEWAHKQTGIDIHPGAMIAPYFFIDHGTGVVIGETCEIGSHVKLYQGVTLGALSFPTDEKGDLVRGQKRHPTVEDRVVIYASATVLGGQTVIGHDCVIGSSVWLTKSVDPHTTVTLEKPKLRMRSDTKANGTVDSEAPAEITAGT